MAFTITQSEYQEFRRRDEQEQTDLQQRSKRDTRRLGQRFYDYFKLHKLTRSEDCIIADKIYNGEHHLIDTILDKGN